MILFLSSWHILIVIGVFLGASAFLGVSGLLSLLWGVWKQLEREQDGWEQQKRERRSAAAKKGWVTRMMKRGSVTYDGRTLSIADVEDRVLRQKAKDEITPDDALGFIRGEDQHGG